MPETPDLHSRPTASVRPVAESASNDGSTSLKPTGQEIVAAP